MALPAYVSILNPERAGPQRESHVYLSSRTPAWDVGTSGTALAPYNYGITSLTVTSYRNESELFEFQACATLARASGW
jgi:hypothetical protein